jgi:hypothetical protein
MTDRHVILSVDAIAFRPMVTISDDGSVDGLKDLTDLDSPDLLTQFLSDPAAFSAFLREHWDSTYTALFVFQIQPLRPDLTCCVVHVIPAVSGRGNNETVEILHAGKSMLADRFGFLVRGFGFDGDSCLNAVHTELHHVWTMSMVADSLPATLPHGQVLIFSDPLHLLKRLRHRFVSSEFPLDLVGNKSTSRSTEFKKRAFAPPWYFLKFSHYKDARFAPFGIVLPKGFRLRFIPVSTQWHRNGNMVPSHGCINFGHYFQENSS